MARTDALFVLGEHAYHVSQAGEVTEVACQSSAAVLSDAATLAGGKAGNGASVRVCVDTAALVVERRVVPRYTNISKARTGLRMVVLREKASHAEALMGFTMPTAKAGSPSSFFAYETDGQLAGLRDALIGHNLDVQGGWPLFALTLKMASQAPGPNGTIVYIVADSFVAGAYVRDGEIHDYKSFPCVEHERESRWRELLLDWAAGRPQASIVVGAMNPEWVQQQPLWEPVCRGATVMMEARRMADLLGTMEPRGAENLFFDASADAQRQVAIVLGVLATVLVVAGITMSVLALLDIRRTPVVVQQIEHEKRVCEERKNTALQRSAQIKRYEENIIDPSAAGGAGAYRVINSIANAIPANTLVGSLTVEQRQFRCELLWYPPVELASAQTARTAPGQTTELSPEAQRQRRLSLRYQAVGGTPGVLTRSPQQLAAEGAQQAADTFAASLATAGYAALREIQPVGSKRYIDSIVVTGKLP